jgi:molecular chaperone DnaK
MSSTVDYGIDLGTTNSLIAKFADGGVRVFKNPVGFGEILPSVVWLRKDATIVGDKALTRRMTKGSVDVFSRFKCRMGTDEAYSVHFQASTITPVELSADVLKELKSFVPEEGDSAVEAVVITVPAAFDTVQSNDTLKAGHLAGFKQVLLLQEPIAASLAYANQHRAGELPNGKWMVYDLGGGTFDLALMSVENGEVRVIDHEGDNFLGGSNFDELIVRQIVVPYLSEHFQVKGIKDLSNASSPHNILWNTLTYRAEQAKVELSAHPGSYIDAEFVDDQGESQELHVPIARSQFEQLIMPSVDRTVTMVKTLLARNHMVPSDVQFLLMVGGSTYIPLVRRRVGELTGIKVSYDIDPVTAVAVGAAYYAGTRRKELSSAAAKQPAAAGTLHIRMAYKATSTETVVPLGVAVEGMVSGLSYRITREDGGYDTGLKHLEARVFEDLRLVERAANVFAFRVFDESGNPVPTDAEPVEILQGIVTVNGQPLPEDISLELDNLLSGETELHLLFRKGSILPLQKSVTVQTSKTVVKGSSDDLIRIKVYQGNHTAAPAANKYLGELTIPGSSIERDVLKGTDIDLTLWEDESQTITVEATVAMTGQVFKNKVFDGEHRHVDVQDLRTDLAGLSQEIAKARSEQTDVESGADEQARDLQQQVRELQRRSEELGNDDTSSSKYQIDDRKRELLQKWTMLSAPRRCAQLKAEYQSVKEDTQKNVGENGNDLDRKALKDILDREDAIMLSSNPLRIQQGIDDLRMLNGSVLWRTPKWLIGLFRWISERRSTLNDAEHGRMLFDAGQVAINSADFERLAAINSQLVNLLPNESQEEIRRVGVGITMI